MLPTMLLPEENDQNNMRTERIDDEEKPKVLAEPSRHLMHNQSAPEASAIQESSMPATLEDHDDHSMPATLEDNDANFTAVATHTVSEDPKNALFPIE